VALFPAWSDTVVRLLLGAALVGAGAALWLAIAWVRLPYFTTEGATVAQPIEFDHRHHVGDDHIDCLFCHESAATGARAGIPSLDVCMGCHAQVWGQSPATAPLRRAYFDGARFAWERVHRLPDYVYFNHALHLHKGVGCVTCHGHVEEMGAVAQAAPLTMGWCLGCHRDPTPYLRPRARLTDASFHADGDPHVRGETLARAYDVRPRLACTTCHR
jgi:hypothetical protein